MTATNWLTEETTILQRFRANWDENDYPVAWPNSPFDPEADAATHLNPKDDAWVRIAIRPAGAEQITMGPAGSRDFLHDGVIFVQIFIRKGAGPGLGDELADTAAAIFRGVSADGIVYDPAPRRTVAGDSGNWHQTNLEVPYRRDSTF